MQQRIEQFIAGHLGRRLDNRRVLVAYDPGARMAEVVRSLANGPHCRVIEVGDDIITARENALDELARLGQDPTLATQLVVYIPRARPLEPEDICIDPFTPLALAGAVFPDGVGDTYLSLCQRFLPEQAGVIEELFRHGDPSYADINSLVVGAEGAPILGGLLGTQGLQNLFVRLLCLEPNEAAKLNRSPHWRKELQALVGKTLGLTLPEAENDINELRNVLWRYLLFSEFAADLPSELPKALQGVPKAPGRHLRFVQDLCGTLRDRNSTQDAYEDAATRVANELGLEAHCAAMEDLGILDTFAFEERCFLRSFAKQFLAGDLDKAGKVVQDRVKSFWIREAGRAVEWQLAGRCIEVMRSVEDMKRICKESPPRNAGGWLAFHVEHGHRLDTAHRLMEQVAQDWMREPGSLMDVLDKVRAAHREFVEDVTRRFQETVVAEGWPVSGYGRANETFDQYVRPLWQSGKRVAYFWVDAFRYDLAKLLVATAADRHVAMVHPVCAQLPSITKVGMAALLPGAGEDFRLAVEGGEVVPVVKGRALPELPQRLEFIKEAIGPSRFASVEIQELLAAKDLSGWTHAEVLVVRTTDIDLIGENNPAHLATLLPGSIRDLNMAVNRLADAGFEAAVMATDHGFCWFDSVEAGHAIQKPTGEWVEVKNRVLLGSGQPAGNVVSMDAAHVGIKGDVAQYVAAKGLATFTKGVRYFHEGLSLAECLIPVVKFNLKPTPKKSPAIGKVELLLTYRGANAGTITTLRPSVEVSMPAGDLFGPVELTFVLHGYGKANKLVAEAASSPLTDPATGEVTIQRGHSIKVPIRIQEEFTGSIELRAEHPGTGEIFAILKLTTDFHH